MQMIEDNFFKLLVDFLLLTEDDISLALNRSILKLGVLKYIADDVNGNRDILAEALGIVNSLFTRGICIQMSAKVFYFQL